ncbi:hypothetical protein AB0O67_06080 [Streptomyces sp. NPDC086077]|uniref:hypothetical protein n=1 Tax=Streptomyces sp. NPDC086077 TaxID=3154862 RepID=UPI00342F6D6A
MPRSEGGSGVRDAGAAEFSGTPDRVGADPDWRERFADEADELVAAFERLLAETGRDPRWTSPGGLSTGARARGE